MPKLALAVGLVLIAVGLIGYLGSGRESLTALIPSILGLVLAGLGLLALGRPSTRKHAMHAAAAFAVLGFLGSLQGIPSIAALLAGDDVERPWAAVVQTVTAVLTAVFTVAAVRSFITARRSRASSVQ